MRGMTNQAGGWKEVFTEDVPAGALQSAARTKVIVENDLGIGHGRIRFFQHDPAVEWNPVDPDIAFAILNTPPFDPEMRGKQIHPSIREQGCTVIWIRADLPVGGMAFVVAHECRHLWQDMTWGDEHQEQREMDANVYAVRGAPLPQDLAEALRKYWTCLYKEED